MSQTKPKYVVLSASRMTDMPAYYPQAITDETEKRIDAGKKIHTLVLWTKHPRALLNTPLIDYLKKKKKSGVQLAVQLTISGMGGIATGKKADGSPLFPEPNAPNYRQALQVIPEIISLTGNPLRIKLRIDPLVKIADAESKKYSNIDTFEPVLKAGAAFGIKEFVFSFLEKGMHKKVDNRFEKAGCRIVPFDDNEREAWRRKIQTWKNQYGVDISACCVRGFPETKCIDGKRLEELHDLAYPTIHSQVRNRPKCGCTKSIDLGGWPPKKCFTGCLYCYSRPAISPAINKQ